MLRWATSFVVTLNVGTASTWARAEIERVTTARRMVVVFAYSPMIPSHYDWSMVSEPTAAAAEQ